MNAFTHNLFLIFKKPQNQKSESDTKSYRELLINSQQRIPAACMTLANIGERNRIH